jgi:hypothetical protein
MRIGKWRPALRRWAAARRLLVGIAVLGLGGALIGGLVWLRPASGHSQTAPPELSGQPGTTTVHSRTQAGFPRFDTFVRGTDGMLWHRWWENSDWSNWENLDIPLDSAPAAGVDPEYSSTDLDVFYRRGGDIWYVVLEVNFTTTRILNHQERYLGSVPGGADLFGFHGGEYITSAPAVSTWPGRIDVFALAGGTHDLVHCWYDFSHSNGWSDWERLSRADFAGDPAAVSWGPGRIDLFIQGADTNSLYHKVFDGHWQSWEELGQGFTMLYSPAAASWAVGRLDVFVVGTDHQLWTKVFDNGQWSGGPTWNGYWPLGGYFISSPGAGSLGAGHLDATGLGHDYQVYHAWYGGQWSPWAGLGVPGTFFTSAPAVVDWWISA